MKTVNFWRNLAPLILAVTLNARALPSGSELLSALTTNRCSPASFAASIESYVGVPGSQTKQRFNLRGFLQDDFFYTSYVSPNYKLPTIAGGVPAEQWNVSGGALSVYKQPGRYLVHRRIKELLEHLDFRTVRTCLATGSDLVVSETGDQVKVEGVPPGTAAFRMVSAFAIVLDKHQALLPTQLELLYKPIKSPTNRVVVNYSGYRKVAGKWFPGTISGRSDLDYSSFLFTIPNLEIAEPKSVQAFMPPAAGSSNWFTASAIKYDTRLEVSPEDTTGDRGTVHMPIGLVATITTNGVDWAEGGVTKALIAEHRTALPDAVSESGRPFNFPWLASIIIVMMIFFSLLLWRKRTNATT